MHVWLQMLLCWSLALLMVVLREVCREHLLEATQVKDNNYSDGALNFTVKSSRCMAKTKGKNWWSRLTTMSVFRLTIIVPLVFLELDVHMWLWVHDLQL